VCIRCDREARGGTVTEYDLREPESVEKKEGLEYTEKEGDNG